MERLPVGLGASSIGNGDFDSNGRGLYELKIEPNDFDHNEHEWVDYEVLIVTGREQRGAITGMLLGILTFVGGICLLALTFSLARDMFLQSPTDLFKIQPGKTLDISQAVAELMAVIIRVLLLLVMAVVGGLIANRGVHLYVDSRHGGSGGGGTPKTSRGFRRKREQRGKMTVEKSGGDEPGSSAARLAS